MVRIVMLAALFIWYQMMRVCSVRLYAAPDQVRDPMDGQKPTTRQRANVVFQSMKN